MDKDEPRDVMTNPYLDSGRGERFRTSPDQIKDTSSNAIICFEDVVICHEDQVVIK